MSSWQIVMIGVLWKLPLAFLFVSLSERWVHKYILHGKWLHDHFRPIRFSYDWHHCQHHGQGENEWKHINLSPVDYWPAIPIFAWAAWRWFVWGQLGGISGMVAIVLVCATHVVLWNKLHRAIHRLENNWTMRIPGYAVFARHHLDHHKRPSRNFGIVFIWTDWVFGSKWSSRE